MKDNDITVSVDQNESLYEAIAVNGLEFGRLGSRKKNTTRVCTEVDFVSVEIRGTDSKNKYKYR